MNPSAARVDYYSTSAPTPSPIGAGGNIFSSTGGQWGVLLFYPRLGLGLELPMGGDYRGTRGRVPQKKQNCLGTQT